MPTMPPPMMTMLLGKVGSALMVRSASRMPSLVMTRGESPPGMSLARMVAEPVAMTVFLARTVIIRPEVKLVNALDQDAARVEQPPDAVQPGDLARLHQVVQPLGQPADHLVFVRDHALPVRSRRGR